jgi:regulator of PEP synthase PpsR (kinase-PPPase family)
MTEENFELPKPIIIVSDGTGETAEKIVRAGLRQFTGHIVHVRTDRYVATVEELEQIFRKATRKGTLICTTLVQPPMRAAARRLSAETGVQHIDLIGNLLAGLERYLQSTASGVPGLLHHADERYFRRIEAVEFTVKADDGKEPKMLNEADVILVGVSRTSKTPLSTFLAHKGLKVSNVPIVLDRPLPPALRLVNPNKVFALTIQAEALYEIRRTRARTMGLGEAANYCDMDYILAELEYAHDFYRANPEWPIIDVTNKALEETAASIIAILRDRGIHGPPGEVSQL